MPTRGVGLHADRNKQASAPLSVSGSLNILCFTLGMVKRPRKPTTPLLREDDALLRGQRRRERDPSQPQLPFDPFPARIEPCLALLKPTPPAGEQWSFEIKWDGYRIAIHKNGNDIRVITRGGYDWSDRFPSIVEAARKLPVVTAILDAEAVVLDDFGRSDFNALQSSLGGRGGKKTSGRAIAMAFDLLYFDGHLLTAMDQDDRRRLLEDLVPADTEGGIRLSQEIEGDGDAIFEAATEHGLEGIICKDRTKPYRSGRGGEWVKVKVIASEGFAILGYERSAAALGGIGRLLLAARKDGVLTYVGGVGTGFTAASGSALRKAMGKLVVDKPIVDMGRKKRTDVVWVKPELVAEIEFRSWTTDGKLRHASYKGLRDAADADDVFEIE